MGEFFENAALFFFKMGVFSKMGVCFLEIRVILQNGSVSRKASFVFFKIYFFRN